jgi:hypothetical protein
MVPVIEVLELIVHDQAVLNQSVQGPDELGGLHLHRAWGHCSLSSRGNRQYLDIVIKNSRRRETTVNLPRPMKMHV